MLEKANQLIFGLSWPLPAAVIASVMLLTGIVSFKRKSVSFSGALAAVLVGFAVTWGLRLEGFIILFTFFIVSDIAGKLRRKKVRRKDGVETKEGPRDMSQVLANGLMAALASIWWLFSGSDAALIMFGAALAESFSDTIAGETGRLSASGPVSIVTFRPVEPGTSGGVTALGALSGFMASALISTMWALLFRPGRAVFGASCICIAGFAGSIVDSLLGALVQAVYRDPEGKRTEKAFDRNGNPNTLVRGMSWMDNDMVNFVSNTFAVVFATGLHLIFA